MNIREQLLVAHSKENTQKITMYIGTDEKRLDELMQCFFSNEYRVTQRAAMSVSDCFDLHPQLMQPYVEQMVDNLSDPKIHVAVKRNTVRILQFIDVPEEHTSALFDHCLSFLIDSKEPIAVKAFSMGILYNICKKYPDLKVEVIPIIEEEIGRSESAGVLNRGKKISKKLYQL